MVCGGLAIPGGAAKVILAGTTLRVAWATAVPVSDTVWVLIVSEMVRVPLKLPV
jgi:hypothetical protein